MSKVNFKNNNFLKSEITDINASPSDSSFLIDVKIEINKFFQDKNEEWQVIFRNSTNIVSFFKENNKIEVKELKYYNVGNSTSVIRENIFAIIQSSDFDNYESNNYFEITVKWTPSSSDYTTLSGSLNFDNTESNTLEFSKIGALKYINNSGIINKSYNKIKEENNNEIGTLPSSKITTGDELISFNDPYKEHNLITFSEQNDVNVSIGLPIKETNIQDKFYLTTSSDILQDPSSLSTSDVRYLDEFDLDNSRVFSTPNKIDSLSNQIKTNKQVSVENLNHVIKQNRFIEEITPFDESKYYFEEESTRSDFYKDSLLFEDSDKFNLGEQKQIKITLDFSDDFDLHLLNTKFSFIYPDASTSTAHFGSSNNKDEIYDTKYFNFLEGDTAETYSSHFAPTAYWNFSGRHWNYLSGYKGIQISDGTDVQLPNNFVFDSGNLDLDTINESHLKDFNYHQIKRPILTTPGFRNDGSFISSNSGEDYNKSAICQITDTYGFPYNINWKPLDNNLLDMSNYLAKDFLLEKVIIKGKFSSKAEMPIKKGNYSSGYAQSSNSLTSLSEFNNDYEMKDFDAEQLYLSNSATFFILNERKNENYFDQNIKVDSLLHYSTLLTDSFDSSSFNKSFGKNLKNYPGSFEVTSDDLSIADYKVENNIVYSLDRFNQLNLDVKSPDVLTSFLSSTSMFKLSSTGGGLSHPFYYKERISWDGTNYNEDITTDTQNRIAYFKSEGSTLETTFDSTKSRDLVTYSNLLITKKRTQDYNNPPNSISIDYDSRVLENIDYHYEIASDNTNSLNVTEQEFEIKSLCKNSNTSDYIDESEFKLKSNYYENVTSQAHVPNQFEIKNVVDQSLTNLDLFNYTPLPTPAINSILGYSLASNTVPQSIDKFTLRIMKKSDETKYDFIKFVFEFDDPDTVNGVSGTYDSYFNWTDDNVIYIKDFIDYSSNGSLNEIKINLRFLKMWNNKTILPHFLSLNKVTEENDQNITEYFVNNIGTQKFVVSSGTWTDFSVKEQSTALSLLVSYALLFKKDIQGSHNLDSPYDSTTFSLNDIFENVSERKVLIKSFDDRNSSFILEESRNNDFTLLDENDDVLFTHHFSTTTTDFEISNEVVGSDRVTTQQRYFQENYVLEGKTQGTNNLDIDTSRVINKKLINEKSIDKFKTNSGKYIQNGEGFNSVVNSNYLLKPSDKLIFGVTSNCNGQVMPTVFKLHDKIEITLIGRDFVDNTLEYKNNLSKSIRRVVLGDNSNNKTRETIYQTKDSYYDNVWSKSNLNKSLEEFKEGKIIIGKNSSREFGTYTGVSLFTNETQIQNNKKLSLYKKDTINPSLGKVFKNYLGLEVVESKNNKNDDVYKIVISEDDSVNTTQNVINKWHKDFHYADSSSTFFSDLNNFSIEDNTLSEIENSKNYDIEICYDTNSYTSSPSFSEYENIANSSKESRYSGSTLENIKNYGKTLKSYALPNSSLQSYQNGIQIQNEEENFVYSENEKKYTKFIKSNLLIEDKDKNTKVNINSYKSSLQYFDSMLNIMQNTNNNPSFINRSTLKEYVNESNNLSNLTINFNPQWHLVLELSVGAFNTLIGNELTLSEIDKEYNNKELSLFLYEDSQQSTESVLKIGRIIKIDETSEEIIIAIPLYFWETLEVDETFLNDDNFLKYGKTVQKTNSYDKLNPAWYATLSDSSKIIDNQDIYKNFVNSTEHSNIDSAYTSNGNKSYPIIDSILASEGSGPSDIQNPDILPYSADTLSSKSDDGDKLVLDISFFISLSSFETSGTKGTNPVYERNQPDFYHLLENHYKLDFHNRFLTNSNYFENNASEINKKVINGLNKSDENDNFYLNEKIYRSKIFKKKEDYFVSTSSYLIYKIHKLYLNETGITSTEDNPLNEYNIVEIIGSDTDYCLFESKTLSDKNVLLNLEENDVIRIYEDKLRKYNYFGDETPYFEIDLSSKSKSFAGQSSGISQILYSHLKLSTSNIDISTDLNSDNSILSGHLGSPIFVINSKSNSDYKHYSSQEDAIKNFFYGFSRGKNRYPIENIDGFKYGVENGSPQSFNFYYSNRRYGHLFDKVNGSTNTAVLKQDIKSKTSIVSFTTQKRFVNPKTFRTVDSVNITNTYNKDLHSRSTHPYIEDSSNQLSQYYEAP